MGGACLYGTGVDLLSLTRFASLLARSRASAAVSSPHARLGRSERLARRILCDEELADWQRLEARHDRVRWLACRWAAKEAAYKALSPPFQISWHDLMLRSASSGRPRLSLSASGTRGALGQFLPPGLRWHVSLSHDAGLVIAMVHLEQPGA